MANKNSALDLVFHALSDPTRRAVLAELSKGPVPIVDLAEPHDMALPSFTKHIAMLEKAGLIRTLKKGRSRICTLRRDRLRLIDDWLGAQREAPADRTDELMTIVHSLYPGRPRRNN